MNFTRTSQNLSRISGHDSLAIDDVLSFFYDFTEDIKDSSGEPVERCAVRDSDLMVKRLLRIGRIVLNTAENNKNSINIPRQQERMNGITTRLAAIDGEIQKLNRLLDEEQERKQQLLRQQQTISEKTRQVQQLQEENCALAEENQRLSSIDLAQEMARKQQLTSQSAELQKCLAHQTEENTAMEQALTALQTQCEEARRQKDELERQRREIAEQQTDLIQKNEATKQEQQKLLEMLRIVQSELDSANQTCTALREERLELESTLTTLHEEVRQAEARLSATQAEVEQNTTRKAELDGARQEYEKQKGAQSVQIQQIETEIREIRQQIVQRKTQLERLREADTGLRQEKEALEHAALEQDSVCAALKEQVEQLAKQLQEKDFSGQQEQLRKLVEQKEQQLEQYRLLCEEIAQKQNQMETERKDFGMKQLELKTAQEQQAIRNETAQKELERMRQKLNDLNGKKIGLDQKMDSCQEQIQLIETWMEGIEAQELLSTIDRLEHRLHVLQTVRENCEHDWNLLWKERADADKLSHGKLLQEDLDVIDDQLDDYRKKLNELISCMSSTEGV